MPGYYQTAPPLPVRPRQRALLEQLISRPSSMQQHVFRARIILLSGEGVGNQAIADELRVDRKRVYRWRTRWLREQDRSNAVSPPAEPGAYPRWLVAVEEEENEAALFQALLSSLSDAPRCGGPVTYRAEVMCQIIAVSCEDPENCGHPIRHWTPKALRIEVQKRAIVTDISLRQVGRF